jgi:hypothetical protein
MTESRRVLSDILAGKLRRNLKDARLRCGDIYTRYGKKIREAIPLVGV